MGAKSRKEQTEDRVVAYRLRMKKKAMEPPLEVTEKGRYYSLKYDYDNGLRLDKSRLELFKKLEKKYG